MASPEEHPHVKLLEELRKEIKPVLDASSQAIYIYLDNEHKICNQKYASMLGYKTTRDWELTADPMLNVEDSSVNGLVAAYRNAVDRKVATTLEVSWKRTDGKAVPSRVILVPFAFKNELMAIHYIETK